MKVLGSNKGTFILQTNRGTKGLLDVGVDSGTVILVNKLKRISRRLNAPEILIHQMTDSKYAQEILDRLEEVTGDEGRDLVRQIKSNMGLAPKSDIEDIAVESKPDAEEEKYFYGVRGGSRRLSS